MDRDFVINVVIVVGVILMIYPFLSPILNPKIREKRMAETYKKRWSAVNEKINSLGGNLVNLEKIRKKDCEVYKELNFEKGSLTVVYKATYVFYHEERETWAIFLLHQRKEELILPLLESREK